MSTAIQYYSAAAGANIVVCAKPAKLIGIFVGKDVASSVIEISDHASDGDGNVQFYWEGSTLMTQLKGGVMFGPNGVDFQKGITLDLTNQTFVTVLYAPIG